MLKKVIVEFYCPTNEHPVARKIIEDTNETIFGAFRSMFESMGGMPGFQSTNDAPTVLATLTLPIDYSLTEDPLDTLFKCIEHTQTSFKNKLSLSSCTYQIKSVETIIESSTETVVELDSASKEV